MLISSKYPTEQKCSSIYSHIGFCAFINWKCLFEKKVLEVFTMQFLLPPTLILMKIQIMWAGRGQNYG